MRISFQDETIVRAGALSALAHFRQGDLDKPLVVFLPGGGHLGRIAYGSPDRSEDFLLPQLSALGFPCLGLSYPTSHPAVHCTIPDLSIAAWAEAVAEIVAARIAASGLRQEVVVAAWSLAGRLAVRLSCALRARELMLVLHVGLAAIPPMPGFGVLRNSDLELAPTLLLDGSSSDSPLLKTREAHLTSVDTLNGRCVLPRDLYTRDYVADTPIALRGEAERIVDGKLKRDVAAAIDDQASYSYTDYPLCAALHGTELPDAVHPLTDRHIWAFLNAKAQFAQYVQPAISAGTLDPAKLPQIEVLFDSLPARFSRRVEGAHLFFLGTLGARRSAAMIVELLDEARTWRADLGALLPT